MYKKKINKLSKEEKENLQNVYNELKKQANENGVIIDDQEELKRRLLKLLIKINEMQTYS